MIAKFKEKERAVALRKDGFTYGEILKRVSVSKSTLSLWLHDVGLARKQKQQMTERKRAAQLRGGAARKSERQIREKNIRSMSKAEIGKLSRRDLWLIGTALYWAEGTKQKQHNVSQGLALINDDCRLLRIFILWTRLIGIPRSRLVFEMYIHDNSRNRRVEVVKYWTKKLGVPKSTPINVYFKRHHTTGYRRKLSVDYFGSLRIKVRASTDLNRKITGWVEGIVEHCQIV